MPRAIVETTPVSVHAAARVLVAVFVVAGCGSATESAKPSPAPAETRVESKAPVDEPATPQSVRQALRSADEGIAKFWAWWSKLDGATRLAIATGEDRARVDALSQHVTEIHPALAWEFGPGKTSEHALTLSGEGNAAVRVVAERWVRAAPPSDARWSYFTTRQAIPEHDLRGGSMEYGGVPLRLEETRLAAEPDSLRPRLSVRVWHPAFVKLDPASRQAVAFLILDQTLGEAGVERRIDRVEVVDAQPENALGLLELRGAVEQLDEQTPEERFAIAKGVDPDTKSPLVWTLDVTLNRWDHPFHEIWCDVAIHYEPKTDGMPGDEDLKALYGLQDALVERLGEQAVLAGTQTGMGRRHVWLFVDGNWETIERAKEWARAQSREITVEAKLDPGWESLPL